MCRKVIVYELISIFTKLADFLDKGSTVDLVYPDSKAFDLLPCGMVSFRLGEVGQERATGKVVICEQRVRQELSVNSQKDGFGDQMSWFCSLP